MEGGSKKRIDDAKGKSIAKEIIKDLTVYDLTEWQKACKGFGPIHNNRETRRDWLEKNRFRLEAAREIVDLVMAWTEQLKSEFDSELLTDIRKRIIATIRLTQQKQKMEKGLLNSVKLSAFRTLIKWADNPRELDEKREYRPRSQTKEQSGISEARRRILGEYGPPRVELDSDYQVQSQSNLELTISIWNEFIHPYQNVELEIELDKRLKIRETKPYTWNPKLSRIIVGFLESSIGDAPKVHVVKVQISILDSSDVYKISGKIFYDDCEKGMRAEKKINQVIITL